MKQKVEQFLNIKKKGRTSRLSTNKHTAMLKIEDY
ncbi:hypothetical protein AJ85_20390 [Alkalihalobacillus alcalophilus ATCC 27647 = CGMCC 1.3604]|uniref:Uncharacterized protein n=1 Tax=Alkalihalobacillus alcalophilus ATCC 27647 = CGMCC 1.3604 TaxID=1218173 RepID=A0A4S4JWC5_ALKAL|nr:hypothetical protein AJ85_20390 [Alkalihalobacillus alcalophilus ATCC 27647 = CGMCC 1.3604]